MACWKNPPHNTLKSLQPTHLQLDETVRYVSIQELAKLAYLTMREYTRSGPVCLGALVLIAGAIIALLPSIDVAYDFFAPNTVLYGAIMAVVGLVLIIIGFALTKKKRDSVLAPIVTKIDDTPPPPPPPD